MSDFVRLGFSETKPEVERFIAFPNVIVCEPPKTILWSILHNPEEWEEDGWQPA